MCKMVKTWEGVLSYLLLFFFFKLRLHSSVWANVINSGTVEVLCPNLLEQKLCILNSGKIRATIFRVYSFQNEWC